MTQTLDPAKLTATATLDASHLTISGATDWSWVLGTEDTTQPHDLGFYWEITGNASITSADTVGFGTANANFAGANSIGRIGSADFTGDTAGWLWGDSAFYIKAAIVGGVSFEVPGVGDRIGLALDVVNGFFYGRVYHSGVWGPWNNGSGDPTAISGGGSLATMNAGPYFPALSNQAVAEAQTAWFAQSSWVGVAPTRFGPFDPAVQIYIPNIHFDNLF